MAGKTLGLDIGSNSIGWALIDEANEKIIASGVRVFPEGVDRDQKGGELSKNETRRVARGMRRQIARRARRKRKLREALILAGLLPAEPTEQQRLDVLNPYELRRRALDERLSLHELGRLLVHLNQRRGFLSNKKADKQKKKEDSETLAEISALAADMQSAGHRTLGEHLAKAYAADPVARIRGKHTRRDMYEQEFDAIWESQRRHHPQTLTDELKHGRRGKQSYPRKPERIGKDAAAALAEVGLYGLIFFQRPMYWPKSVVGQCELEPKKKRCPRADRAAQRFRVLLEVNNLRIFTADGEIKELTAEQRQALLKLLARKKEATFDEIRKTLKLFENDGFNLEAGDRRKLLGMPTDHALAHKSLFGKEWHDKSEDEKTSIVRSLLHDDEETVVRRAKEEWSLDEATAASLLDVDLPDGYSSYGRDAIDNLLPFLEQGFPLMTRDETPCALKLAGYLRPDERLRGQKQFLPEPPDVTNPLVRQALFEVRKLINAIIREYDAFDAVHVELAREVKGSFEQRRKQGLEMRLREADRDRVAKILEEEYKEKATRKKIDLYRLWEEQGGECFYSFPSRKIGVRQLLGGEVNVDHILPYTRSLDDSLMNKVVCFRSENDDKDNRTPYEWLAGTNPRKYEAILQRAARLPIEFRNRKRPRFSQKSCELTDFINRQLTDTAYITRTVLDYLKCLGCDLLAGKGQLTAELRHQWGLNDILRNDGLDLKNRDDHRHHAIDAIVIAFTNRSRLQKLAGCRGQQELPLPWKSFRADTETSVNAINVSHRVRRKVAGKLHLDTLFGTSHDEQNTFVRRKSVESLDNTKHLEKVRDSTVREILRSYLRDHGIDPSEPRKLTNAIWADGPRMRSGVPIRNVRMLEHGEGYAEIRPGVFAEMSSNHHIEIYEILDGSGGPVLAKDGQSKRSGYIVRMLDVAQRIRDAQRELARSRDQLAKKALSSKKLKSALKEEQVRIAKACPLIMRRRGPNERFVMSLAINEMILLELGGGKTVLHRVQKLSDAGIILRPHTYAGKCSDTDKPPMIQRRSPNTLRGRKVTVDVIGRVRWAND